MIKNNQIVSFLYDLGPITTLLGNSLLIEIRANEKDSIFILQIGPK